MKASFVGVSVISFSSQSVTSGGHSPCQGLLLRQSYSVSSFVIPPSPRACVSFCHTHCALQSHVENGPFMGQISAPFSLLQVVRSGPPSLCMRITSSDPADQSTVSALCCVRAPLRPCARRSDAAHSCAEQTVFKKLTGTSCREVHMSALLNIM
jgi:hypothetical protein